MRRSSRCLFAVASLWNGLFVLGQTGGDPCASVNADEDVTTDPMDKHYGGPLLTNYDLIRSAAQHALDSYDPPAGSGELMEATAKDGTALMGALFKDDGVDTCYVGFRGAANNFEWIADLDASIAYQKVMDSPKKRCRVLKTYKKLYSQKGRGVNGFKSMLNNKLEECWANGRTVVFTGHDLGGALAIMGGVEYSKRDNLWTVTFGNPPVFMPPQYTAPENLRKRARAKNPCRYLDFDKYVPFVNAELEFPPGVTESASAQLRYDFMYYLNELIYKIEKDNVGPGGKGRPAILDQPVTVQCVLDLVEKTRMFMDAKKKGNLGSAFGRRYLLPATGSASYFTEGDGTQYELNINYLFYPVTERKTINGEPGPIRPSFGNSGIDWIEYEYVNDPSLRAPNTACNPGRIHAMETYLEKIMAANDIGGRFFAGFRCADRCNMLVDCVQGLECNSAGSCLPNSGDRGNNQAMMK